MVQRSAIGLRTSTGGKELPSSLAMAMLHSPESWQVLGPPSKDSRQFSSAQPPVAQRALPITCWGYSDQLPQQEGAVRIVWIQVGSRVASTDGGCLSLCIKNPRVPSTWHSFCRQVLFFNLRWQ
jgi:hypothetical protein